MLPMLEQVETNPIFWASPLTVCPPLSFGVPKLFSATCQSAKGEQVSWHMELTGRRGRSV